MALKVEKNKNEDPKNLVRRFSRKLRRTGILRQAREKQYYEEPKSEQMKKRSALRKKELKEKYKKKKKLGEL